MDHLLHIAVAEAIQESIKGSCELLKDSACGGTQHLPLFVGAVKGRDTLMCNVDLLVVSNSHVRVIIEIEESGFLPTKIFGKFLQSAIATHFIHESQPKTVDPYDEQVLFVQVLDGLKCLRPGTKKNAQGGLIERKINEMLPLKGSSISDYRLFFIRGIGDRKNLKLVGEAVVEALN